MADQYKTNTVLGEHNILDEVVGRKTAPLKKQAAKIRSKQPTRSSKKVKFITTEIRCQEKSKGGLSYEVILAEPSVTTPALKLSGPAATAAPKPTSTDEIEKKLKEAEDRRLAREAKIQQDWTVKVAKIGEASRKKEEFNSSFINSTKEQLDAKMETVVEKREALISDKKEKLKTQLQEIEKTRTQLEKQRDEEREAIEEKLRLAAQKRDENIKHKLDRLKEHNCTKVEEVKMKVKEVESPETRQVVKNLIENKLFMAEQNREKELQKRLEHLRKHDRHVELVRQNKAALDDSVTASSG